MNIALDSKCGPAPPADDRAAELYAERLHAGHVRVDRLFAALLPIQWLAAVAFALWLSPYTWAGEAAAIHAHVWAAVALGGLIVALPLCLIQWHPGRTETRHCVAVAQMLVGALLIHVSGGRIETHFHIFGSLAFLALYRDWRVLILASAVVAMDHFVRGVFWPRSVYGITTASPWRWMEHTAWVLFEDLVLIRGVRQSLAELHDLAARQAEAEAARASVDRLVEERTAELGRANAALVVEVAERRRAEQALRESEERFRLMADSAPVIIFVTDPRFQCTFVNRTGAEFCGVPAEELHGDAWEGLIHPDDLGRYLELRRSVVPGRAAGPGRAAAPPRRRRLSLDGDHRDAPLPPRRHLRRHRQHGGRHHRAQGGRGHAAAGQGGRRGGQPRQERVPRQHEPRDPHADERHHRHDRAGPGHRADARGSASTSAWSGARPTRCWR